MANKQYKSIIRLFDYCSIDMREELNLSRIKKQLQAEFGITSDGFIEVDGFTYTRHDVFEELEKPDFQQRLVFHKKIWNSPAILQLLERSILDLSIIKSEIRQFTGDKAFDEFFSPYFTGPFNYLSRNYLASHNMVDAGHLLVYEDFLQPEEREEAFQPIRIFLDENRRLLRNVTKENYSLMRPKIIDWIQSDWSIFFNNLPHEFYEIKTDIVAILINLGVAIQKSNKKDCVRMSEYLTAVQDIPEDLRKLILSNHIAYTGSSSSSSKSWWSSGGFWVIWVFIAIIKAISSDSCNQREPSYQSMPPFKSSQIMLDTTLHYTPDTTFKSMADSILNEIRKRQAQQNFK